MDIEHLREFVAIVDAGTLARAAVALDLSAPTLRRHMAAVEQTLGTALLHGDSLTPAGEQFYTDAKTVLRAYETALEHAAFASRPTPALRLVVDTFVGYKPGDDLLAVLEMGSASRQRPLDLTIRDITTTFQLDNLKNGGCDLCVYAHHPQNDVDVEGLTAVPLMPDPLVAIVRDEHPLAGRDEIWIRDIGSEIVWTYDSPSVRRYYGLLESILRRNGASPHCIPTPWTNARDMYRNLAYFEGGMHITHASIARFSAKLAPQGYRVLRIRDDDAQMRTFVHYRTDSENPAVPMAVEAFKAMALDLGDSPY